MAAPSQFSAERLERVVDALRLGASRVGAASCAGIAPSTLHEWFRRGRAGEEPFADLWERVQAEQRAWEVEALRRIHDAAAKGTWTAAAWLLERRLPRRYGRQMSDAAVYREAVKLMKAEVAAAERHLSVEGREDHAASGGPSQRPQG